jgi:xanthine dehydrogenase accessory factor
MNNATETQAIIDAYRRAEAEGVCAALATVVTVEGSAYRRPGARMLITETRERTGVLSGGCLEQDVCERAQKVIETGNPALIVYDTTADDDIVWGLGVGCRGVVKVLVESTTGGQLDELFQLLGDCVETQRRGAVATVIQQRNKIDAPIITRTLLHPDGERDSFSGAVIQPTVFEDLRSAVQSGASTVQRYELDTGSLDVFIEVIEPQVPLVIFGAGDDVMPLVTLAGTLGCRTTVVDTRARRGSIGRFADANEVMLCLPEDVRDSVSLTPSTAAIVMTHNYLHDLELLKTLLNTDVAYIGCLGPRRRTQRLLLELTDDNETAAMQCLEQLHAPAGLDIGAETPIEIALSIVAEIKAVLKQREGGLLKKRNGSIHANVVEHCPPRAVPFNVGSSAFLSQLLLRQAS